VSDVIERAGMGRNTFYVLFRDLGAALQTAEADALSEVEAVFATPIEAHTPIERLRSMSSAWLSLAAAKPHLVHLVVRGDGRARGAHSRLRRTIMGALESVATTARSAGVLGRPVDHGRLRGVAGAFLTFAEETIENRSKANPGALAQELADFALRAFR
jgi:AcrR family transcriptional regulator